MPVTDADATALSKLGAPRHAETTRSGDTPEHWPKRELPTSMASRRVEDELEPGTLRRCAGVHRQSPGRVDLACVRRAGGTQ
jgi:hypothetical protein